jgi:hypothetical protein
MFVKPHFSERAAKILASVFFVVSLLLCAALAGTWRFISKLDLKMPDSGWPVKQTSSAALPPVSPLLLRYELDLPGRGEIFPALVASGASDYWPLATLNIANTSDRPVIQIIAAEVPGWTRPSVQTVVLAPHETRTFNLNPDLLPAAYDNEEIRRATLVVTAGNPTSGISFAQNRALNLHSASDLYWGKKFANAQFLVRWVTPHDPSVLLLVSEAKRWAPNGRMPGYGFKTDSPAATSTVVKQQVNAAFEAIRSAGMSYVSSIFTFGDFIDQAQRIRLPRETLSLSSANCIDVSVLFAAMMENLGLKPVIVIVPGHAFAGVRLGPQSSEILYLDLTVLPKGTLKSAISRANGWIKKTPPDQVITVDISAARALGIYPMTEPPPQVKAASLAAR